jgi:hypothetical protein
MWEIYQFKFSVKDTKWHLENSKYQNCRSDTLFLNESIVTRTSETFLSIVALGENLYVEWRKTLIVDTEWVEHVTVVCYSSNKQISRSLTS